MEGVKKCLGQPNENAEVTVLFSKMTVQCVTCLFFFNPRQVLQEETSIPGSDLNLIYLSSRASGYKPVLKVAMTQSSIPFNLMKVRNVATSDRSLYHFDLICPFFDPNAVSPGSPDGGGGGSPFPEMVPRPTQSVLYLHLGQDGRLRAARLRPV